MTSANQRIARKLDQLRLADPKCLVFGVETHRYRLAPCLSLAQLQSLERHFEVSFPEDYQSFVTEVGNGGAGPGYGLQRLGRVQSRQEIPTAEPKGPSRIIQQKTNFTLARQDLYDADGKYVDPFDVSFYDSIQSLVDGSNDPASLRHPFSLSAPIRNADEKQWDSIQPSLGTWILADYGCAMSAHLVLNGDFTGHVWMCDPNTLSFVPFNEMAPLHYSDTGADIDAKDVNATFSFARWYEHWIDHALKSACDEYGSE